MTDRGPPAPDVLAVPDPQGAVMLRNVIGRDICVADHLESAFGEYFDPGQGTLANGSVPDVVLCWGCGTPPWKGANNQRLH